MSARIFCEMVQQKTSRFATYVWVVLAFLLLVILWGAVVRATGSGAGCGDHWPLCNGQVIPQTNANSTFIEFFHRVTSGLALVLVAFIAFGARRTFEPGHPARKGAWVSLGFIVVESLIGAVIVVQELTAKNDSVARAVIIAVHQANTLLLIGAVTLTGWFASTVSPASPDRERINGNGSGANRVTKLAIAGGAIGLIVLSATGAITALGDTLFHLLRWSKVGKQSLYQVHTFWCNCGLCIHSSRLAWVRMSLCWVGGSCATSPVPTLNGWHLHSRACFWHSARWVG